jgi:hypothetical protein
LLAFHESPQLGLHGASRSLQNAPKGRRTNQLYQGTAQSQWDSNSTPKGVKVNGMRATKTQAICQKNHAAPRRVVAPASA